MTTKDLFGLPEHSRAAINQLGDDEAVAICSLIKLRRDLPDGAADRALEAYRRALLPIIEGVGAEKLVDAAVAFTFSGLQGRWDVVQVTRFPSKHAFFESLGYDGMEVVKKARDDGFEELLALLTVGPASKVYSAASIETATRRQGSK